MEHLAIDIGASSGRHILGFEENGRIVMREIYRFENRQVWKNGHRCWDLSHLIEQIKEGLKACRALGHVPATIGIDTWAVDYVLLDQNGDLVGDAVSYRDSRTEQITDIAENMVPFAALYARCGIQQQPFNTVYQLLSQQRQDPGVLEKARHLLLIPDYLHYCLTGQMAWEYTNATTTSLVGAKEKTWDTSLLRSFSLPEGLFGPISQPGTVLGDLLPSVKREVGFDGHRVQVVLPATHDTASAFLAAPILPGEKSLVLSSGTWSLLGAEREEPLCSENARLHNFTNEGGAFGTWRFLKNSMGLWMLQSLRREANGESYVKGEKAPERAAINSISFAALCDMAKREIDFPTRVDPNDSRFLAPDSMWDEIQKACREAGGPVPQNLGQAAACVYHSLAQDYARVVREIAGVTGDTYNTLHIVGGGCRDALLNTLTKQQTGLSVTAGPVEATALGNLMMQMISMGTFQNREEARAAARRSFPIETVKE